LESIGHERPLEISDIALECENPEGEVTKMEPLNELEVACGDVLNCENEYPVLEPTKIKIFHGLDLINDLQEKMAERSDSFGKFQRTVDVIECDGIAEKDASFDAAKIFGRTQKSLPTQCSELQIQISAPNLENTL
jgi:hypothetical protein